MRNFLELEWYRKLDIDCDIIGYYRVPLRNCNLSNWIKKEFFWRHELHLQIESYNDYIVIWSSDDNWIVYEHIVFWLSSDYLLWHCERSCSHKIDKINMRFAWVTIYIVYSSLRSILLRNLSNSTCIQLLAYIH